MQPKEYDAVLGTNPSSPVELGVLGGLEGVKQRLKSTIATHRIAALQEAQKFGQAGLELIIQALQDQSLQVQKAAYSLLQGRKEAKVQQALQAYYPYPLFECLAILQGHASGITAVAIAPDGRTIISSSRDEAIKVWDWWAREPIFSFNAHTFVFAITIDPDGETFTIRGRSQILKAWCLRTGRQIRPEKQQTRGISSVTTSEERHLISGSQNLIKVWNLQTGREICALEGHSSLVTSVADSPAHQLIVSGSEDRTVRVWGVA
jgi:WD40 repeat protein